MMFPPEAEEPEEPDEEEVPDVLEEDLLDELLEAVSFFTPPGVLEEYVPVTTLQECHSRHCILPYSSRPLQERQ